VNFEFNSHYIAHTKLRLHSMSFMPFHTSVTGAVSLVRQGTIKYWL